MYLFERSRTLTTGVQPSRSFSGAGYNLMLGDESCLQLLDVFVETFSREFTIRAGVREETPDAVNGRN